MNRPASEFGARPSARPRAVRAGGPRRLGGGRRGQRGQTLIIFALSVTMLIGFVGLAIDALRAYDLYAREQRAAEAGALAAVTYMPCFYSSTSGATGCSTGTSPDGNTAISRALLEVRKNGFGATATANSPCADVQTTQEVMTCTVTGSPTAVRVTITEPATVVLLSVVGVQTFNVTATAVAAYTVPFPLGSNPQSPDSNSWGDGGSANPKHFLAAINGPAEFKEQGDPYVYCEEGPSFSGQFGAAVTPDQNYVTINPPIQLVDSVTNTDAGPTSSGFYTNHPAYQNGPRCGVNGNPDQQPPAFVGPATTGTVHPGAYNYAISVTDPAGATVYIYNPPFDPVDPQSSCNGDQTQDVFLQDLTCTDYYRQYGPLTFDGTHFDDPRFYFDMTYALYPAPDQFDVAPSGTPEAVQTYHPLDGLKADLQAHGCSTNGQDYYDLSQVSTYTQAKGGGILLPILGCDSTATAPADAAYTWQQLNTTPLAVGVHRLTVEATSFIPDDNPNGACPAAFTCGWGRHTYSILVCKVGTTPSQGACAPGGFINPWNDMDLYLNFPSAGGALIHNVVVPLAYIPGSNDGSTSLAGRTIDIGIYDPGDSHGNGDNSYFIIVPPNCMTIPYPAGARTTTYPGTISPAPVGCTPSLTSVQSAAQNKGNQPSDDIYNGLWINMAVTLPSNYAGGEWYYMSYSSQGKGFDQIAISLTLAGSGTLIHLVQ